MEGSHPVESLFRSYESYLLYLGRSSSQHSGYGQAEGGGVLRPALVSLKVRKALCLLSPALSGH